VRALTAVFGFLVTARTLIRVTNAEMRRLATATTADNPRWPRLQRRAAVLSGSNLLLAVAFNTIRRDCERRNSGSQ
jgi:hypothetical protein